MNIICEMPLNPAKSTRSKLSPNSKLVRNQLKQDELSIQPWVNLFIWCYRPHVDKYSNSLQSLGACPIRAIGC